MSLAFTKKRESVELLIRSSVKIAAAVPAAPAAVAAAAVAAVAAATVAAYAVTAFATSVIAAAGRRGAVCVGRSLAAAVNVSGGLCCFGHASHCL